MESGIYMRDGSSTEDAKAAGLSPLRLRVGVFLILLWIVPFWILAEPIAHSLSGLSKPSISYRYYDSHRRRTDHHWAARVLGRRH